MSLVVCHWCRRGIATGHAEDCARPREAPTTLAAYEGLDGARLVVGLDLATPPGQASAAQLLRFETMPDGTTRAFRVTPAPAKPTDADAELLEVLRDFAIEAMLAHPNWGNRTCPECLAIRGLRARLEAVGALADIDARFEARR